VTGVRCGDEELEADVVVDATGRRTPVDRWLRTAGAAPTTVDSAECGLAYFSRHYLVREGSAIPPGAPRMLVARDGHLLGLWVGDNAAVQLAVVPLVGDRRFRELAEVGLFTRTLLEEPSFARWLTVLAPTGPVHVMGGVRNSFRRLVVDGRPVVRGLHVVGDSLCTTNPTLSRGLALTFTAAVDLVDVLTRHPDDSLQQALVYDAHVDRHVAPYFRDQVAIDAERLTELRHAAFGTSPARRRPCATAVSFGELRDASPRDLVVERAFWRLQGMVCDPHAVYADPEVVRRTRAVLATPRGHELRNTSRKKSTEERSHVAAHR
jgi:flavin-dependent dehydrogenase